MICLWVHDLREMICMKGKGMEGKGIAAYIRRQRCIEPWALGLRDCSIFDCHFEIPCLHCCIPD